jgi:hypothetical protein
MNTVQSVQITTGTSQKTGKPFTRYDALLDNGVTASGFEYVNIGDVVEIEQKGEFINYKKIGKTVGNRPPPGLFTPPTYTPATNPITNPMSKDDYWRNKEKRDLEKDPRIERQSARRDAVDFHALECSNGQVPSLDRVIQIMHIMESWLDSVNAGADK